VPGCASLPGILASARVERTLLSAAFDVDLAFDFCLTNQVGGAPLLAPFEKWAAGQPTPERVFHFCTATTRSVLSRRNSAIASLHTHALGYDAIIVLSASNKSALLAYQNLAASQVVIDANVLLALENWKTGVEKLITETSAHLEQIAELAFPPSLTYDLEYSVTALVAPQATIEEINLSRWQREASNRIITVVPGPDTTGWFGDTTSQMGDLGRTLWPPAGDPIDCRMPTDIASAFNPPGYYAFVGTDSETVSTFVFLPWFLLLREISEYQELLGVVVTAIATLLSRLRSIAVSHAIAVCQRSFFTHHGAHPPENRSQSHLGPFSGRVFQTQVAA
jgi:hypothetical protein